MSRYNTKNDDDLIIMYNGINHLIISFPLVFVIVGVVAITDVVDVIVVDDVVISLLWYFFGRFATAQNTCLITSYASYLKLSTEAWPNRI